MTFLGVVILAVGLSLDAFAISICKGVSVQKVAPKHLFIIGTWFGLAQTMMALLGFILGSGFSVFIQNLEHWLTAVLLILIGINMIIQSHSTPKSLTASFSAKAMLPLAIANSLDALVIGVSFSFLEINIISAALIIGLCTFLFSAVGVKLGNIFGIRLRSHAEITGGVLLILLGIIVFVQHVLYCS